MNDYQKDFIRFALETDVLRFGSFTLKSGRISPYFFNAGLFNTGKSLAKLGKYYAAAIENSNIEYDMIYGPAYKGIPLAAATCISLSEDYNKDIPYAFNRKEAKDHGEGGMIVGSPLKGKVLIIDDVISAGTSVRESFDIIQKSGATTSGVVIALDRQEKGQGDISAIQEVEQQYHLKVAHIIGLDSILDYLQGKNDQPERIQQVLDYKKTYGV